MNIVQQIEFAAEEYRIALGLRTWDDQRGWALRAWDARYQQGHDSKSDGPERQSGRTTRDILLAIAACMVTGIRDVKIEANRALGPIWAQRFEEFMIKLGVNISLHKSNSRIVKPFITYIDHHENETQ